METNKDPFIGITGTDRRGIGWRVARKLKPDTVLVRHQTYVIEFDNGTSKEYSGQHLQGCALGTTKNWGMITSRVSAEEYVGKEYPTKDGHVVKILRVTKNRPAYDRSLVEIEWDGNPDKKCVIDLHKIIGTAGAKPLTMDERLFQGPRELTKTEILTNSLSRGSANGSYCKLPDGMDVYYAVTGTLKRHEHIMNRCYNPNDKDYYNYGGKGVTVADEWLNLYNFAVWSNENYVLNWDLDKDLLVSGNNEYRPDRCTFIPHVMNTVIINKPKIDGLPTGVYKNSSNTSKHVSPYCTEMGLFGKPIGYNVQTVMEGFVFYKLTKEFAIHEMAKRLFTSNSERDRKLLNAAEDYRVLDRRNTKDNLITEEMVMDFLRKACGDTPDLKDRNYVYLKNLYMTRASLVFERKKRMIIEILDNEFVEEEDNYDYNF